MPLHDLRCPACEVTEKDVYFRASAGFPACPDCGNARNVDWSHGAAPAVKGEGYGSFTAIDMGVLGKAETKEDYDRMKSVIEKRFPGHRIELESESKGQKQARLDGLKQRSYEAKKREGFDDQSRREAAAEQRAKKSEMDGRAARANTAPPKAHMSTPGQSV
jgi:hypothetical protein